MITKETNNSKAGKDRQADMEIEVKDIEQEELGSGGSGGKGDIDEFNKYKSVFNEFQDDTPEYLKRMLDQDIKYSKVP